MKQISTELKADRILIYWHPSCWICDTNDNLNKHHIIPIRMNPKKNMVIPLCVPCHTKFNMEADVNKITELKNKIRDVLK